MAIHTLLVSTWSDGLYVLEGRATQREMLGRQVHGLAAFDASSNGAALAIVDAHTLFRRDSVGEWQQLVKSAAPLSCCLISGPDIFVGTDDDAHLLRLDGDRLRPCNSFDATPGRDTWVAGAMLVDGKMMGPPLGIRSMSATSDRSALFANVHVGGIPRSIDRGVSWQPTIAVDADVHQVACHPSRPHLVAAAAAVGLCISRDGGVSWQIETDGLHEPHCSAVAFVGDDILVSAAKDPFAAVGVVYRRSLDGPSRLTPVAGGLPLRMAGIVDTACIVARERSAAIIDSAGNVYRSEDAGHSWAHEATSCAGPSGATLL